MSNATKQQTIAALWRKSNLSWKLDPSQKELYDMYYSSTKKINTWLWARRSGKSHSLIVLAFEECLRRPNSIVKYLAPTKLQVKTIIAPLIRKIAEDCPADLKPWFDTKEFCYFFPNGSKIEMAGADSGHAEKLRGSDSHLAIVDEAGSIADLGYIVTDILGPTTLITKGKILLASTPPRYAEHEFNEFIEKAEANDTLVKKTIYDNPRLTPEDIEDVIRDCGGILSDSFQREYLCVDEHTLVRTQTGYKEIQHIEIGENVLTHKGRFRPVVNKFLNRRDDRQMYKLKTTNCLGSKLTGDHKVLVATCNKNTKHITEEFQRIDNINLASETFKKYIKVPINYEFNGNQDAELASLVGWYIAEGNQGVNQSVVLSLNYNDPFEQIDNLSLKYFGKRMKKTHGQGCFQAGLYSKKAKEFFAQFGKGAKNKFIPNYWKNGSREAKIQLLKSLFLGDGHKNVSKGLASYSSISKQLIADVSDILLSLDIVHGISQSAAAGPSVILGRNVTINDRYEIRLTGKHFSKFVDIVFNIQHTPISQRARSFIKDGYLYARITNISQIPYAKDVVYDIEVEEDHSYVGLHCTYHNCICVKDQNLTVVPEFTDTLQKEVVKEWPLPPHYDAYVAMDLGFKDLTVALYGYYDFRAAKLIIQDEVVANFQEPDMNLPKFVHLLMEKEKELWTDPLTLEVKKPTARVSDIEYIVLQEISRASAAKMSFTVTQKYDKDSAINNLRLLLTTKKIIISPKCKTLIHHLRNVRWYSDKNRRTFARGKDGSHFDAVDAASYFTRSVNMNKNPYPATFDYNAKDLYVARPDNIYGNSQLNAFAKIFNKKPTWNNSGKLTWKNNGSK